MTGPSGDMVSFPVTSKANCDWQHACEGKSRMSRFLSPLAVIAVVGLMGQATPSKVGRLEIAGETGIMKLDVSPEGYPRLVLVDRKGINRMGLTIGPRGPVLFLADEEWYYSFLLDSGPKGTRLELTTQKVLYAPFNTPLESFRGPLIVDEPLPSDLALTSSGLSLSQWGIDRAKFSLLDDGSPEVKLFDVEKKVIWSAP